MKRVNAFDKPAALVIDDDPEMQLLCSRSLQRCGFTVLTSSGLGSATELARQHRNLALLIIDVLLRAPLFRLAGHEVEKAANGIEALPTLRRLYPRAKPLIISAYSKEELIAEGHDPGDMAFLQKPFDPPTLRRTVDALLPGLVADGNDSVEAGGGCLVRLDNHHPVNPRSSLLPMASRSATYRSLPCPKLFSPDYS